MHLTIHAFDKCSSGNYSESIEVKTKEEMNSEFKRFEENIPFVKWYYEIQPEEVLSEEEEEVLSEHDWAY